MTLTISTTPKAININPTTRLIHVKTLKLRKSLILLAIKHLTVSVKNTPPSVPAKNIANSGDLTPYLALTRLTTLNQKIIRKGFSIFIKNPLKTYLNMFAGRSGRLIVELWEIFAFLLYVYIPKRISMNPPIMPTRI